MPIPRLALHPLRFFHTRFEHWLHNRLPFTDCLTLNQRNVYILPTRAGLMLAVTLMVLLLASINYQLNLGYLLTFLLAGCAVVAMHVAHGNLRGLELNLIAPNACFMGATATFHVQLHNPNRQPRFGLAVAVQDAAQAVDTDVGAQAQVSVQLAFTPTQRGLQRVPTLALHTLYPLGTFRVWALWRPAAQVLVYPTPEAHPPPLPGQGSSHGAHSRAQRHTQGEPDGMRPYRAGDALKHIVWKKAAKTGQLVSREHHPHVAHTLLLDPQLTQLNQLEPQLSRLCAWVLQAEQQGLRYGLRLAHQTLPTDHGSAHQQRCLQALALA